MSNTREELLSCAEDLLRTRGHSGYSYADAAARVGVNKATIHYYFPTKQDLTLAALQAYRDRYRNAMVGIEDEFDNALDRVEAYGKLYLWGVEKGRGCLCSALSAELETLPEDLKHGTAAFFRDHLDWLERVIAKGRRQGEINANLTNAGAARLIIGSLEGALMMERLLDGGAGFEITLKALRTSLSSAP